MLNFASCSVDDIFMRRQSIRRELLATEGLQDLRVAVLGESTTNEVVNLWEILLLANGFKPVFYQSEYGRVYEEAVHDSKALVDFKPELIYLHTSCWNVRNKPALNCNAADFDSCVEAEIARFREIWDSLKSNLNCQVIQNNFETPPYAILGNLDAIACGGLSRFFMQLNISLAQEVSLRPAVSLQDVHGISAMLGMSRWFDWKRHFGYKLLLTPEANLEIARSLTSIVRAMFGRSRKVLVLDLDDTLWGGVIGDDDVDKIQIGPETPMGEAYAAFQEYCLSLRNRGVLLAVCSKNTEEIAKMGFENPGSILKLEHFSSFKANWEAKHENIYAIAQELNLGVDSFVFVDDNPAERAIVEAMLPGVAVPDVGGDVTRFAEIIEHGRYFEPFSFSTEDFQRTAFYAENSKRAQAERKYADYGEYLDSLEMKAEIDCFKPMYLERLAQLTNKTNQFNLTARRYTQAEVESISRNPGFIGLYGKLSDRFGDNGLISVAIGRRDVDTLHIEAWLMSCRVLKREMEFAMCDALVERARAIGVATIQGYYLPTQKNGIVADLYQTLGFQPCPPLPDLPPGATVWTLALRGQGKRNHHIKVLE
ncbi:MAG: HAD-IIIC family phosphatase [Terracidiphilus sp.]